jgi:CBS domain containing-hemolysin-like protein
MHTALYILSALLLVAACGVFVAAEFSFITVNRTTVDRLAARGDHRARGVQKALRSLSTQLSGAQVGITITNLAIGLLAEPAIASLIENPLRAIGVPDMMLPGIAIALGIATATAVTMVFGELVPKNLAIAKPLATALAMQGMQRAFSQGMKFPIRLLNQSANFVLRRMGIVPQEELASARSADELSSLVRRSAEKGTLPRETALMLERSLRFGELSAVDVMTPRRRVRSVQAHDPVSRVLTLARQTGFSRFPVTDKGVDDVVGTVHIKRAVGVKAAERSTTTVQQVMHQPLVVPSSIQLDPLLHTLRSGGIQMAVVIDEFGGTDGIVTIEDLIEELVGEVRDEHDRTYKAVHHRDDGSWALSGLLRPDEVGQYTGIFVPDEEEFETLGGLVASRLGRVPDVDDVARIAAVDRDGNNLTISVKVERMDGRRVDRVRLEAQGHIVDTPETES